MPHRPFSLEDRIIALEQDKADIKKLVAMTSDVARLVELLQQVETALKLFAGLGRGMKWTVSIVATPVAIYYLLIKRDYSGIATLFTSRGP